MSSLKEKSLSSDGASKKIRITLTSTDVKALEKVCADLKATAADKKPALKCKGPIRMPTKNLKITTRKSPCGEGTNTWDRFEMRIHKRVFNLYSSTAAVQQMTAISIEPNVDVDITIPDE